MREPHEKKREENGQDVKDGFKGKILLSFLPPFFAGNSCVENIDNTKGNTNNNVNTTIVFTQTSFIHIQR